MNTRRYFIRLFKGGIVNWLDEKADVLPLVKIFDLDDPEQSVYEVENGEEEWLTAVAYILTTPKHGTEPVSLLRIHAEELLRFRISVDAQQPGTTGVVWVDHRHRNLCADKGQLTQLVQYLAPLCRRGHDLVRRVLKDQLTRSMNRICEYKEVHCPPHVKRIAHWAFKEADRPVLDFGSVRKEMSRVELEDDIIIPRARVQGSGDDLANWYAALRSLRQDYADLYLSELAKRLGLRPPASSAAGSP